MLNSGPGKVGQAAEVTAAAGPGQTPVSGNVQEDPSPSEAGWGQAPDQPNSSRQERNNSTSEAGDRLP